MDSLWAVCQYACDRPNMDVQTGTCSRMQPHSNPQPLLHTHAHTHTHTHTHTRRACKRPEMRTRSTAHLSDDTACTHTQPQGEHASAQRCAHIQQRTSVMTQPVHTHNHKESMQAPSDAYTFSSAPQ